MRSMSDCKISMGWGWDLTVYDSKMGLYSFQLDDYDANEAGSDIELDLHEEESEEARLEGQKLAALQAKVDHFERKREELIKQQKKLVDEANTSFSLKNPLQLQEGLDQ
jgi:hypothetical protein